MSKENPQPATASGARRGQPKETDQEEKNVAAAVPAESSAGRATGRPEPARPFHATHLYHRGRQLRTIAECGRSARRLHFVQPPDGAESQGNKEIFLYDTGANFLTQVTHSSQSGNIGPKVSADGRRVAFVSTENLTGQNADGNADIFLAEVPLPRPPAALAQPPLAVVLANVRKGRRRVLKVRVLFADTGAVRAEILSPFRPPAYRALTATLLDLDGDGTLDAVLLTARQGKRRLRRTLTL
jgi:hypothetical protein